MATNPFVFMGSLAILLTVLSLIQLSDARTLTQTLNLNRFTKEKWHFITRFGCGIGRCTFTFKFKTTKSISSLYPGKRPLPFHLLIYATDHTWPDAMSYEDLRARGDQAYMRKIVELPTNGDDSWPYQYHLLREVKSRVYYFFFADLENVLEGKQFDQDVKLAIDFTITNVDRSHISQEEYGLQFSHFAMAILYVAFFGLNISRIRSYYKKEQEIDYPFVILTSACLVEFGALAFEWLHLLLQEIYGYPLFLTNFLSGTFSMFAQLLITCLLLLIASGWSITYHKIGDLDIFVLLGAVVTFFHIIFVIFGQSQDDNPYSSHDYENYPGIILLISKVCFFAIFAAFLWQTYKKADPKLRKFILIFAGLGAVYLLTLPVAVFIVSTFVDIHARHRAIVISNMILQSITLLILTALLTSKKSPYYAISFKGRSNLPSMISKLN